MAAVTWPRSHDRQGHVITEVMWPQGRLPVCSCLVHMCRKEARDCVALQIKHKTSPAVLLEKAQTTEPCSRISRQNVSPHPSFLYTSAEMLLCPKCPGASNSQLQNTAASFKGRCCRGTWGFLVSLYLPIPPFCYKVGHPGYSNLILVGQVEPCRFKFPSSGLEDKFQ